MKITSEILDQHNVTPEEYERIKQLMGREPNITELGIFSVMWSEHCSYKSSKIHRRRLVRGLQDRIAQPPVVHRTLSGRGDGRRRHPARHLHDGRAARGGDEQPAFRPDSR